MVGLRIKFADYLIIGAILLAGFSGFWFNIQESSAAERKYAVVYVKNEKVAELSISADDSYFYSFQFGAQKEHNAVLEIDGGRIRMLPLGEDLCPRGICSHTGWITYSYESIVCLPNQVMIVFSENTAPGDSSDLDGVTY